jgi:hypothetical protein
MEEFEMWRDQLLKIKKDLEQYSFEMNDGATEEELSAFEKACLTELGMELPKDYADVLRTVNGLDYDGLNLYGIDAEYRKSEPKEKTDGLIERNHFWHCNDWDQAYLFVGNNDMSWYVYNPENMVYSELDLPSGAKIQDYPNLNAMMDNILS